ncbi:MAG: cardiolipin synthase A [Gemmatales bacterium]|nr:MAG: cardiolipin synthase A [Gemmatales bacterium]
MFDLWEWLLNLYEARDAKTWAGLYFIGEWLVRIVMLAWVPMKRSPAAAASWLILIFFVPFVGLFLFLWFGYRQLPSWRLQRLQRAEKAIQQIGDRFHKEHPHIFHPTLPPELNHAVRLAQKLGKMPILGGNSVELLVVYDDIIDRLVSDIDTAEHNVHLLYYIFADDRTGKKVMDALVRARKRGVTCRVLFDSLGTGRAYRALYRKLAPVGVQIEAMLPVGIFPLLRARMARPDLRNHRKIAVIDGRVAYTGSQNLVDAKYKEGITYEELMVRLTGPIVLELQAVFAADWYVETEEVLDDDLIFPDPEIAGEVPAQALPSGPGYEIENNQRVIVSLIHGARERVVITTPYFIPDLALLQALQTAVLRGVDVKLILSQKEDQVLVHLAQQSYYEELLEVGVEIHLYKEKFLHAKHLTIDDSIAFVGSSNIDIRSFCLNAEISVLFYDRSVTAQLRAEQERYLTRCEALSMEKWSGRQLPKRFAQNVARLMSPVL